MADAARWEPTVAGGTTGTDQVQDTAREKAEELKDTVRESSTQLSSTARDWVQQEADQRTTAIGSQARTIADAMRETSSRLNDDGQSQAARMTDMVADRVDQAASYLEQTDGERLMRDVQDMARRNPWAFAAGGLLVGFAASRFMKASRSNEYDSTYTTTRSAYPTEAGSYGAAGAYGTTRTTGTTGVGTTGTGTSGTLPSAPGTTGEYGGTGTYGETGATGS